MHNLHLVVVKADSPEDACIEAECQIEDYGNENNWRVICGCVSEDDERYNTGEGRYPVQDTDTIKSLNKLVEGWVSSPDPLTVNVRNAKAAMRRAAYPKKFKKPVTWHDWHQIAKYAEHMSSSVNYRIDNTIKINVLDNQFREWELVEEGITNLCDSEETTGSKKYVVFVDMHL